MKFSYYLKILFFFCFIILVLACTLPQYVSQDKPDSFPATTDSLITQESLDPVVPPTEEVNPSQTDQDPGAKVFYVVVIVDTSSEMVTYEQAQALITDANQILKRLTDFSVEMIDFVQAAAPMSGEIRDLSALIDAYVQNNPDTLPDSFMIISFGHDGDAKLYGGYAYIYRAPADHLYRFVSTHSTTPVFHVGVVHYSHRYAACGYNHNEEPIQQTSLGGECRNRDGIACVMSNGYQMCEDSVNDLYASTPTYFSATSVVHEIMHNFGHEDDFAYDHYGTQLCTDWMDSSASSRPYDREDHHMFQQYTGICPIVFDRFVDSFNPDPVPYPLCYFCFSPTRFVTATPSDDT